MSLVVHLMGAVRLVRDGRPVHVGGPKQQAVLAALALSAGRRISTDRLIDLVWDDDPPTSARRTAQSYVASLRGALGSGALLRRSQNGYTLDVTRDAVDLLCFEDETVNLLGDVGLDPDTKAQRLADLLSTWETPVDGLRGASRLKELTAPFEELRLQAIEGLASAQIAGSHAGDAVMMLEALVREHPTRENLWLELATGLNRLGRRDAALNAIQRAREALREQLGVHPSALLSTLETDLLNDHITGGVRTLSHGAESGANIDAAPTERARQPHSLPNPLSSFVGRAQEIGEVAQLLSQERLVTLRGLGGIGKTSLALRVAAQQQPQFDDGAWFIDLTYVARTAAVCEKFLDAIGLPSQSEVAPLDQLLTHLRPLRALLVVDNCEGHLDGVSDVLDHILRSAPHVQVLATSRRSLAIAGEAVWHVGPLEASTALELFVDRARLVRHDFVLSDTNRHIVESICEKLDGIPLALELAAARLNVLGLTQILEHLDDRFGLLTDQVRRNDERALQSALDWSYALLDERESSLLRRLTVFPVGFTLEAASEICDENAGILDVVNSMELLVETSLVVFDANDVDPTYRLLETVREYASGKLSASERSDVEQRHARHYVEVAARIADRFTTDHLGALLAADSDLDNLRAAMTFAFAHAEPEWGLSIARHLGAYFFARQLNVEFLGWLRTGIEQTDPESDDALLAVAFALVAAANSGSIDVAEQLAGRVERSLDLALDPSVRVRLLTSYAAHLSDIDPRAADALLAEATVLFKGIDELAIVSCIHNRLEIAWRTRDLPHAAAMATDLDELPDRPFVRRERVLLDIHTAACTGSWEYVVDASVQHYGLDEESSIGLLHLRAEALGALRRFDEAIATLDELDELEKHDHLARSDSQILRATIELRRGAAAAAKSLLAESAASMMREADRVRRAAVASLSGAAAHQLGDNVAAALHFGHARAIADEFGVNMRLSERPLVERAVRDCRADLGPERFDELADRGALSNWSELVELLI